MLSIFELVLGSNLKTSYALFISAYCAISLATFVPANDLYVYSRAEISKILSTKIQCGIQRHIYDINAFIAFNLMNFFRETEVKDEILLEKCLNQLECHIYLP